MSILEWVVLVFLCISFVIYCAIIAIELYASIQERCKKKMCYSCKKLSYIKANNEFHCTGWGILHPFTRCPKYCSHFEKREEKEDEK